MTEEINNFVNNSITYILSLKCIVTHPETNVVPLIKSPRKTGFLELIITLRSIGNIFNDILKSNDLEFLLT